MERFEIYRSLPRPSRAGSWSAEPPNGTPWRVARSHEDHPAILISFEGAASQESSIRRLAIILYVPPASVEILDEAGAQQVGRMAVLECRSTDDTLAHYFFRIVAALLIDGGSVADEGSLETAIDAIVTLFRAIQRPGERTVQGLWGELAIIAWSADPKKALSAWHSSPRALHDFSAGNERLEVKSTTRGLREHSFRLEQLSRHGGAQTIIASLLLDQTEDGLSVNDLVRMITERVGGGESARRLETVVAQSLGAEWQEADLIRFDPESARENLRFYAAEDIPCVPMPIPIEVKEVSFVVDLSMVCCRKLGDLLDVGALCAATLPQDKGLWKWRDDG